MAKWKAPENCSGVNVGGEQFNVGDDGCIETPDDGDYGAALLAHGFEPFVAKRAAKAAKSEEPAA